MPLGTFRTFSAYVGATVDVPSTAGTEHLARDFVSTVDAAGTPLRLGAVSESTHRHETAQLPVYNRPPRCGHHTCGHTETLSLHPLQRNRTLSVASVSHTYSACTAPFDTRETALVGAAVSQCCPRTSRLCFQSVTAQVAGVHRARDTERHVTAQRPGHNKSTTLWTPQRPRHCLRNNAVSCIFTCTPIFTVIFVSILIFVFISYSLCSLSVSSSSLQLFPNFFSHPHSFVNSHSHS